MNVKHASGVGYSVRPQQQGAEPGSKLNCQTISLLLRLGTGVLAIVLAGSALLRVKQLAYSGELAGDDTIPALEEAIRIVPEDAQLHARIAELDPTRDDELARAIALNPREPSWWIMQALRQEQAGNVAGAEVSLRQAIAVAHYFVPWWTLTAFYYRQGMVREFIHSARTTLSVGTGDSQSVFQMATNLKISPAEFHRKGLPERAAPVAAYLAYCLEKAEWRIAREVALELIRIGDSRDSPQVLAACEKLFLQGSNDDAVELWNAAIKAQRLSMTLLDPVAGTVLNDGAFSRQRVERGFDWKLPSRTEVLVFSPPEKGIGIEFNGKQPEYCELLSQLLPLLPHSRYKLTTRFRTRGLPADSGLRWVISPLPAGKTVLATSTSLSSETVREESLVFETPLNATPFQLLLTYTRLPGTVRIEGQLWIESVQLSPTSKV